MNMEVFNLVLGGLMIVIAAYLAFTRGGSMSEKMADISAAIENAKGWVGAAEQLYATGKLSRDQRFMWVFERLKKEFPDMDEDTLAGSIENAVHWYKAVAAKQ